MSAQTCFTIDPLTNEIMMDPVTKSISVTTATVETVRQRIISEIQTFYQEYFLDDTRGFPYFDELSKKNPDLSKIKNLFIAKISQITDVKQITEITLDFNSSARRLTVRFKVIAVSGEAVEGAVL